MIKTVLFDLDDTLYDEIDYCRSGFQAVSEYMSGVYGVSGDQAFKIMWQEFNFGDRGRVFNAVFEGLGISADDEGIFKLVEVYRGHKPDILLPDDSEEVLRGLSENYKLGLVSDGYLPAQRLKVEALGIENYFETMVFTEELGREFWKPSPRGFEVACENLGSSYEQCVYVADNAEKDFEGPNKLGFGGTIQLIREKKVHFGEGKSEISRPGHVINSLLELEVLIESL